MKVKPDILKLNIFKDNYNHLPYVTGKCIITKGNGKVINFTGLSHKYIESFTLTIIKLCKEKIYGTTRAFYLSILYEKSQEKAHNCFSIHLKGRKRTNN